MAHQKHTERGLEDMAADAVTVARQLNETARRLNAGGSALDAAAVRRILERLLDGHVFDTREEGCLEALRGYLEADLTSEIVGWETRFVETHFDEFGPNGERREVPVYSQRGAELEQLCNRLTAFCVLRDRVIDRVKAERELTRMLSG